MRTAENDPGSRVAGFSWGGVLVAEHGVALPALKRFSEKGKPLRLIQLSVSTDDPDPKVISC